MKTLTKLTLALVLLGASLSAHARPPYTNIVQGIAFQLTFLTQGPTNHPNTNVTVATVDKSRITARDIIAALGDATTNTFSPTARLVRIHQVSDTNEITAIEVRDGTNHVDVTGFFTGTYTESPIRALTYNAATGIATGVSYGLLHLNISNTPPYNLVGSLKVAGAAVNKHATIKTGSKLLGVSEVTADVAGVATGTNGVPGIVSGTVTISGHTVEIQ